MKDIDYIGGESSEYISNLSPGAAPRLIGDNAPSTESVRLEVSADKPLAGHPGICNAVGVTALNIVPAKIELHPHHPHRRLEQMENHVIAIGKALHAHMRGEQTFEAWSAFDDLMREYETYVDEARKLPIYHGGLEVDTSRWGTRS